jgi:hypothetical protein
MIAVSADRKMKIWTWTETLANAFAMFSLGTSCSFAHLRAAANCGFLAGSADPPPTLSLIKRLDDINWNILLTATAISWSTGNEK